MERTTVGVRMRDVIRSVLSGTGLLRPVRGARAALQRRRHDVRSRSLIARYLTTVRPRKLQLGCGANLLAGWLNSDSEPLSESVIRVDARARLPFDDSTFDYVFSEHMIEHIEYPEGRAMLRECFRVLRPGGWLRIATPDLRFLIELYAPQKNDLQRRYIAWATRTFISDIGKEEDVFVINNFFRAWGHQFIYDFKALSGVMTEVGFERVQARKVAESDDPELRGLESHGASIPEEFNRLETLVVEGMKAPA